MNRDKTNDAKRNRATERRRIERELERLREGTRCSEAAGGCDRAEIEIAELEHRLRQLTEEAT